MYIDRSPLSRFVLISQLNKGVENIELESITGLQCASRISIGASSRIILCGRHDGRRDDAIRPHCQQIVLMKVI